MTVGAHDPGPRARALRRFGSFRHDDRRRLCRPLRPAQRFPPFLTPESVFAGEPTPLRSKRSSLAALLRLSTTPMPTRCEVPRALPITPDHRMGNQPIRPRSTRIPPSSPGAPARAEPKRHILLLRIGGGVYEAEFSLARSIRYPKARAQGGGGGLRSVAMGGERNPSRRPCIGTGSGGLQHLRINTKTSVIGIRHLRDPVFRSRRWFEWP